MHKYLISALLFFSLASCKMEITQGQWINESISEETKSDSIIFSKPLRFFDSESRLQYSIYNNNYQLIIYVKATEYLVQQKIVQNGIELKFDTLGTFKNNLIILYPIPNKGKNAGIQGDWEIFKNRFSYDYSYLKIKSSVIEDEQLIDKKNAINVSIHWDEKGMLLYKCTVPFSELFSQNNIDFYNKRIGLVIKIKASKAQEPSDQPASTANRSYDDRQELRNAAMYKGQTITVQSEQGFMYTEPSIRCIYQPAGP